MNKFQFISPDKLKETAKKNQSEIESAFKKLKKKKPKNLDSVVQRLHFDVFEQYDCLNCANCCKSISPIITDKDVVRLSKHLNLKEVDFINQYLHLDEDNDYVFNESPCPFLMPDNYCIVYENRPRACREYPHTDRKRFYQILNLSLKNMEVCPVVYAISNELKTRTGSLKKNPEIKI